MDSNPAGSSVHKDSSDKNTEVSYHALLQGIFPTQGLNPRLPHCASLVAQTVKRFPAMLETWVQSLGWEDPLEMEMVTHSSTLAWKIPWTEEPGKLQSMGLQRVGHN